MLTVWRILFSLGIKFWKTDCYKTVTLSTDKCLTLPALKKVAILMTKWYTPTSKDPSPQLQACLTNPGRKEYSNSFSSFIDIHYSTVFDSLFSIYMQGLDLKIAWILHIRFSLKYIYVAFKPTASFFVRQWIRKNKWYFLLWNVVSISVKNLNV
jgi:hypothetical protein